MSYSVSMYNRMIADRVRIDAYTRAMRSVIHPGAIVADIGTGSGYFAVLACQLGAAKVYAIEPDVVVELAMAVAAQSGFADKIEFIQELSTKTTLKERVDVVVSDLRGGLPFHQQIIPSIVDLRQRFLKPGGVLLPSRDELYAVLFRSEEFLSEVTEASSGLNGEPDLSASRRILRNNRVGRRVTPDECVSEHRHMGTVDYRSIESPNFRSSISWTAAENGTAHGFCAWFDATIHDDIGFSNAPGCPDTVYGRSVFPFLEPIEYEQGDTIELTFEAFLVSASYVYRWVTRVVSGKDASTKAHLRQSTMDAELFSPIAMRRKRSDYIPNPLAKHKHVQFILERVDGTTTLESIARALTAAFPADFTRWEQALGLASETIEKSS